MPPGIVQAHEARGRCINSGGRLRPARTTDDAEAVRRCRTFRAMDRGADRDALRALLAGTIRSRARDGVVTLESGVVVTLKKTALHAEHVRLGAQLVDFAGWDMPIQYASHLDEHHAVRQAAGLFALSHIPAVEFSGAPHRQLPPK